MDSLAIKPRMSAPLAAHGARSGWRLPALTGWALPRRAGRRAGRLAAALLLSGALLLPAQAGTFQGGLDALEKGYFKEALSDFADATKQGDPRAGVYVGLMLWHGVATKQDRALAVRYFTFAADQGDPMAQYYLGNIHQDATGLRHLQKAAQSGFAPAQVDLGLRYHAGQGVEVDLKRAAYWYTQAAESGEPRAFDRLAVMHYYGQWFEKNPQIAAYNALIAARLYQSTKFRETQQKNLRAFTRGTTPANAALIEFSAAEKANVLLRERRAEIQEMLHQRALLGSNFAYLASEKPDLAGSVEATNLLSFLERGMAYFITGRCDDARHAFEKAHERREGQGRALAYLNRMDECPSVIAPDIS